MSFVEHLKFAKAKPFVVPRAAMGYFKSFIGMPVLRTVDFGVSAKCSFQCKMCSATKIYRGGEELSVKEIISTFQDAQKLGAIHINLTGAEPLMRDIDELCEIIKGCSPKKNLISLVTNSIHCTKEKLARLKNAGLDTLQISIESLDEKKNDEIRGTKGHFWKAMNAMYDARDLGLIVCLSCVLSEDTWEDVENIIDFAKGKAFVLINPVSSAGRGGMKILDYNRYSKLLKNRHVRADTVSNFRIKQGCPGPERIHITAYGDVIQCPHVQIAFGNVRNESLISIWRKMLSVPHYSEISDKCKHVFGKDFNEKILSKIENLEELPIQYEEFLKL